MDMRDIDGTAVIEAIDQPTAVVDTTDNIVECNGEFRALVDDPDPSSLAALSVYPDLCEQVREREPGIVSIDTDAGDCYYDIRISEVSTDDGSHVGDLLIFHDVTAQQRQQRTLEQQNERLDEFASLISHDLRNPLDVAIGRTTAIEEEITDEEAAEHVQKLRAAHERMRQIVQNVLALARQGRSIDDTSTVELADVASRAWAHVDTSDATLDIETETVVVADRERLEQVFENLFRNSVEHGLPAEADDDRAVTVTVGDLESTSGFYVADDGQGIPDETTQILESGYTEREGNTGLGLGIMRNIAEAHDWQVAICESDGGGARFEFSGVEVPTDEALAGDQ